MIALTCTLILLLTVATVALSVLVAVLEGALDSTVSEAPAAVLAGCAWTVYLPGGMVDCAATDRHAAIRANVYRLRFAANHGAGTVWGHS